MHHGAVVGLDHRGDVVLAVGDPDIEIYPRSCAKPLQAAAMLAAGLVLPDELVALVAASHDGTPTHVAGVRAILETVGCSERDLANTPTWPLDPIAAEAAIRAHDLPCSIFQNCSGKHAGMIATARANGWGVEGYLHPDHPVQRLIIEYLDRATGGVSHVGIDGCGAPTPVCRLRGLAEAVRRLAIEGHPVTRAMIEHPEMVGGASRDVTALMRAVPGLVAKDGAEGVYVAALADGRAAALKIADGAGRARLPVMVAALRALGVDVPVDSLVEPVLGHGRPVGSVRSVIGTP